MKQVKVNIYSFDELSEEAKQRALDDWNEDDTYNWDAEARDAIEAFEELFNVEVRKWNFSAYDHNFNLYTGAIDDDVLALKGNRARAWFWNKAGHLLLEPKVDYWTHLDGKLFKAVAIDSRKYRSKVFFTRCYDGTCPFTGTFVDNPFLDPIAYFCFGTKWDDKLKKRVQDYGCRKIYLDNRNTVESILHDCCESFFQALEEDWADQQSMEHFAETCEANEYRFTKDGEMWSGALEAMEPTEVKEERKAS